MAFTQNYGNKKQHLNLSYSAYQIVLSDMFTFGKKEMSGFINRVLEYYCPVADASISRVLNILKGKLEKSLSTVCADDIEKTRIINRLLQQKEKKLLQQTESYSKGKGFKFDLTVSNLSHLSEENSECGEDKYYKTRGKYIKSVIEEYASLPYVKREIIYFTPYINAIYAAIEKEYQLHIVTDTNKDYSVYPYKILCDPLSTTNYLVGYSKHYEISDDEKHPCAFKISAIKNIIDNKSKSAFLKKAEKDALDKYINIRGVQFMLTEEMDIYVRLTEKGIYKYSRLVHLRPPVIEKQGNNMFIFRCTEAQAEFYFFKFGEDAEIISPSSLRDKFRTKYENAAETYRDK